jgi:hypothetical protein
MVVYPKEEGKTVRAVHAESARALPSAVHL